jgi:hypothetical protein
MATSAAAAFGLTIPPFGINEINPSLSATQMLFHLWWSGIFYLKSIKLA